MKIFTNHKIEWLIGITCAFLPGVIGWFINKTANIPDITIPFWLLCILISLPLAYLAINQYSKRFKNITNEKYTVEKITLDGKHFSNCSFDGTELIFQGIKGFSFIHSDFSTMPRIKFDRNAAITINQLITLYSDPSFRSIVDATFENIKKQGLEIEHNKSSR